MSRLVALPLLTALAGACTAGEGGRASVVERRDSAGVRIVESAAPVRADTVLRIGPDPVVQVGRREGSADETLYGVRDVRFAGDDILVAQQTELRVYDEAGGLRERIGRAGGGPGEFERLVSAAFCDRRIIASEMYSRIVIFDADRTPRSLPLPRPSNPGLLTPLYLYACDRDHLYGTIADGVVRVHPADAAVDTLLVHAGTQIYDGLRVPFGRSTLVAIRDSVIYLVDTARPEIRMHGADGQLQRIVRLNLEPRPVTSADIDRIRAQYLDGCRLRSRRRSGLDWMR